MGRRKSFTEAAGSGALSVSDVATTPPTRVPIAECVARPDNPRPIDGDVSELAASLRQSGQIQPAVVASRDVYLRSRPDHASEVGDAGWVVLAGNRRLAACREAGLLELVVHVGDDRVDTIIEVGIIENVQREPLTPVREAMELQQLLDWYSTTRAVADRIGKSHVYVSQRVSLLKLVPQLQAAVDSGEIPVQDGRELARLPQTQQLEAYQAGPPYSPKKRAQKQAAASVSPGDAETYTRTELPPVGNAVSKAGSDASDEKPRGGDGATAPTGTVASTATEPEKGAANSRQLFSHASLPADPGELATAIEREYSADQRATLIELLQQ